jgi:hypothetical protein
VIDTRPTFLSAVSWHIIRYWLLLAKITILFHFTKAFAEKMITGTDQWNRPRDHFVPAPPVLLFLSVSLIFASKILTTDM